MDADGSLDPRELPRVLTRWSPAPPTSCSARAAPERGAWPLHARVANRGRSRARRCAAAPAAALRDLGPMRAARREPLLALGLRDRRFGWPLEMVVRAAAAGMAHRGGPTVGYRPREGGRSKVTGIAAGDAARACATWRRCWRERAAPGSGSPPPEPGRRDRQGAGRALQDAPVPAVHAARGGRARGGRARGHARRGGRDARRPPGCSCSPASRGVARARLRARSPSAGAASPSAWRPHSRTRALRRC